MKTVFGGGLVLALASAAVAQPVELITNGGFETGDFTGWTTTTAAGSNAQSRYVTGNTTSTPTSNRATPGPASGAFYAVSDMFGPGANAMTQSVTVPAGVTSAIISYKMFVSSVGPFENNNNYDFTNPNTALRSNLSRVDLLGGSPADVFTLGSELLVNFYVGIDSNGLAPWVSYSFDVTSLVAAGGTFTLRFSEVDWRGQMNQGVDDVSFAVEVVPTPTAALLGLAGLAPLGMARRRR